MNLIRIPEPSPDSSLSAGLPKAINWQDTAGPTDKQLRTQCGSLLLGACYLWRLSHAPGAQVVGINDSKSRESKRLQHPIIARDIRERSETPSLSGFVYNCIGTVAVQNSESREQEKKIILILFNFVYFFF